MSSVESKLIKSVGFDIGTATTHVVFSEILLKKNQQSRTKKFEIVSRKLLFTSEIYLTPLLENNVSIDTKKLDLIFKEIYEEAGISINDVDTGAVIVTGETARKENAEAVVSLMADNAGKFVAATAGPHFESIISARGSGAVDESKKHNFNAISVDIGGGTSNIAYIKNGEIISTACINVGGRLLVFTAENNEFTIIKTEPAFVKASEDLLSEEQIKLGSKLSKKQLNLVIDKLVNSLFESLTQSANTHSRLTRKLLMTTPLLIESNNNLKLIISGGVSEYIYNKSLNKHYGDIGYFLAQSILNKLKSFPKFELYEPRERIRATVIGAGQYTLEVSGSTTYVSGSNKFPLRNFPTVLPLINTRELTIDLVADAIKKSLERLDINPETDSFALAFHNPVGPVYDRITKFAKGIEKALHKYFLDENKPLIFIFDTDIGNSVGNILRRETNFKNPIISIDEIYLQEGDFIDIGEPIVDNKVFPVILKSLIFSD